MRILFVGDVMGKIGRRALVKLLPVLQSETKADVTIVNAENLAHGAGVTESTLRDLAGLNIDAYTGGNHSLSKPESPPLYDAPGSTLLRPQNLTGTHPGKGLLELDIHGTPLYILNLLGTLFMKEPADNPFLAFDAAWETIHLKTAGLRPRLLVDFHAEATSEKYAFARYVDGRASAVIGTHTHVATADGSVLPGGTAFVSDAGMTGFRDGVIGVATQQALKAFVGAGKEDADMPDKGNAQINAVLVELATDGHALGITRIDRETKVP